MADQTRITREQMRLRATECDLAGEKVSEVIALMDRLIQTLRSEGNGAVAQMFVDRFEGLRPSFVVAQNLFQKLATELLGTETMLEQYAQFAADNEFDGLI